MTSPTPRAAIVFAALCAGWNPYRRERRARLAADQQAAGYWAAREQAFREVLHRANQAALEYLQAWAGVTRTGYHGTRVDGREPGRFQAAGLIVTSWLQGTSAIRSVS